MKKQSLKTFTDEELIKECDRRSIPAWKLIVQQNSPRIENCPICHQTKNLLRTFEYWWLSTNHNRLCSECIDVLWEEFQDKHPYWKGADRFGGFTLNQLEKKLRKEK